MALPLSAQLCIVQSTVMQPAILPDDTFEIDGTVLSGQVLQLVYRKDFLAFGFVLPIDSVVITGFDGLQPAMQVACHTSDPACTVYPDSNAQLRGCLTISNVQQMYFSPNYPGYELLQVFVAYVMQAPFVGMVTAADTLRLHYRVYNFADTLPTMSPLPLGMAMELGPNPTARQVQVRYVLRASDAVAISVIDARGRVVMQESLGRQGAGEHLISVDLSQWPAGIYVVRLRAGQSYAARRLMKWG